MATTKSAPRRPKTLAEIPDEYLDCRDLGHSWSPRAAIENKKYHNFTRVLVCGRCDTERIQIIAQTGRILGYSYHYPVGYLLRGAGVMTIDDRARMRLRNLRRIL